MPISCAVSGSSGALRGSARPERACARTGAASPTSASEQRDEDMLSGNQPTAMPPPSRRLAVVEACRAAAPGSRPRRSRSSTFWMTIERPKVTSSGGRMSVAERAVEQAALQHVAEHEHHRHARLQAAQRADAGPQLSATHQREVGAKHDEVAVRDVDQAHDAEDQRQPHGEQRVQAAEQHALNDGVEPFSRSSPRARSRRARSASRVSSSRAAGQRDRGPRCKQ